MSGSCNFLAANLYAKSIFGEDALMNVSVEKQKNGKIAGYIRIRSKTQGIALSLGEKITAKQRGSGGSGSGASSGSASSGHGPSGAAAAVAALGAPADVMKHISHAV